MSCGDDDCKIDWTPKNGAIILFEDKRAATLSLKSELSVLEKKLDAGTITNSELRRLIKIILKLVRISRD